MIMEPLTILGALFGSFLNRILPEFVLILLLAIVLAATANRTVSKGFALWAKESKENKTKATGGAYSKVASEEDVERALTTRGGGSGGGSGGGGYRVGQRVKVKDREFDRWAGGTVVAGPSSPTGKPRVKKDGHDKAFVWNFVEADRVDSGRAAAGASSANRASTPNAGGDRGKGSTLPSDGYPLSDVVSPASPGEAEELAGGDVVTELGLVEVVDK